MFTLIIITTNTTTTTTTGAEVFMEERNKLYLQRTRYEWQILLSTGQTLLLASQISESDRNDWVDTINMVIAYLLKMKKASGKC